jgi:murein DD-endopeptidase MepM/ murein hydrolase activator NlpD
MKQYLKSFLAVYKKSFNKGKYYNFTASKYTKIKALALDTPLQQLFIPLLPVLFWFLCFSTIDPYNRYEAIKPHFASNFKDQVLDLPKLPSVNMPPANPAVSPVASPATNSPLTQAPAQQNAQWQTEIIKPRTTLGDIFIKHHLSAEQLQAVLSSGPDARALHHIKPNQKLELLLGSKGELQGLKYYINSTDTLILQAKDTGFSSKTERLIPEQHIGYAGGVIKNSFYVAAQKAGLNSSQIMDLVKAFHSKIDFGREIHSGDSFRVLFEEQLLHEKRVRTGNILAAEFNANGKPYKIVRYTDPKGRTDYYTPDGNSTSLAFVRKPVANARISSPFSMHRVHPILHTLMPHYGTDFAAPIGTPIKATGDGHIAFAGNQQGYGNVVIIRHNERYSTLYAHMSRFGKTAKVGSPIKLGQVIGYVGMTGRTSGPHVHFEFRVNGKRYDPMKIPLPHSNAIPRVYKKDFITTLNTFNKLLDQGSGSTSINV